MSLSNRDPEKIVEFLQTSLVPGGAGFVQAYLRDVRPSEEERERMRFSMVLYPIVASYGIICAYDKRQLHDLMSRATAIYLSRIADQTRMVRFGDYIVWPTEQIAVAKVMQLNFGLDVGNTGFEALGIQFGVLINATFLVRMNSYLTDVRHGFSQAENHNQQLQMAFMSLGMSFTRYVLRMDDGLLPPDEQRRYRFSVAHSGQLLGHGFFNVFEYIKELCG
ncbi:MAG: hypothetical protein PHV34_22305 [Verrucomicrobiae bacterium]|nr:hypothetical protein [Verrucomicrobiae bacterium]